MPIIGEECQALVENVCNRLLRVYLCYLEGIFVFIMDECGDLDQAIPLLVYLLRF